MELLLVGEHLESLGFYDRIPRVIHKTDLGIHADFFNSSEWQSLKFVPASQVSQEIPRIKTALGNPTYCLLSGNCEHFARFVMEGHSYSTQVQLASVLASSVLLIWLSNND